MAQFASGKSIYAGSIEILQLAFLCTALVSFHTFSQVLPHAMEIKLVQRWTSIPRSVYMVTDQQAQVHVNHLTDLSA